MSYIRQLASPEAEPVPRDQAKLFIRIDGTKEDSIVDLLIQCGREYAEVITGRSLAKRQFVQVLDSHPYYTDTIQSQLAYPPSYYSLPRYSTTLWNYAQMIKLMRSPVISVEQIRSVKPDGSIQEMAQDTDFILDRVSEPARIFPIPGSYWPPDLYVANAVQITFTAGYDPDPAAVDEHALGSPPPDNPGQQPDSTLHVGVPATIQVAILQLVAHWWKNRQAVMESGKLTEVPLGIQNLLNANAIYDFAPTRG